MTDLQRTLVLLKPDALARGLVGLILARYEAKGLTIEAMELRRADVTLADQHYADHVDQPWYPGMRDYFTSGPLLALVLSGPSAIPIVRLLNGPTDAAAAPGGTIRGDFALSYRENLVHASDSEAAATQEIGLWFPALS